MKTTASLERSRKMTTFLTYLALVLGSIIMIFPFAWMILTSSKTIPESLAIPPSIFPKELILDNFRDAIASLPFLNLYWNTALMIFFRVVCAIVFSSMAGYAFAKYKFRGKEVLFVMFLLTMMVPQELNLTPLYLIYSRLGLLNTYTVQIITGIANVFAMFMFRKNMETIPDSLIESAKIEGAGHFKIFTKIIVPVSKPVFGALAILVYLSKWNEFLLPKMFISKTELLPIMVILPTLSVGDNLYAVPWELVLTGCTLVIIPLVIIFLMFQDKFLASVTIGAVKG